MLDFLKGLVSDRLPQLAARYGATALIALGAKASVSIDPNDAASVAKVVGEFAVAGILILIDHFSHAQQQAAAA